jgi:hypothetical protein
MVIAALGWYQADRVLFYWTYVQEESMEESGLQRRMVLWF